MQPTPTSFPKYAVFDPCEVAPVSLPKAAILPRFDLMTEKEKVAVSLHIMMKILEKKFFSEMIQKWMKLAGRMKL